MKFRYFAKQEFFGAPDAEHKDKSTLCEISDFKELCRLNTQNYGIFRLINEFKGRRLIENLEKIHSYYVDTDEGSKELIRGLVKKGLPPSSIIETKRGYHIYWFSSGDCSLEDFRNIEDRLVLFFSADKAAKDAARILRAPGFYHCKDPQNKFLIKEVFKSSFTYDVLSMKSFFPLPKKQEQQLEQQKTLRTVMKEAGASDWDYFNDLDCSYALSVLSGSTCVNNEIYDFKKNTNGTQQIFVNKKSSSSWIDAKGKIGSYKKGGPTIWQWLEYFNYSKKEIIEILKQYFPEGFRKE